ncbi:MAG TPA: endo-1,4-beta-xylanase [Steroidobacteraceae bacterium]|nr:endo-1,4-beta-xylanase [Steroidobacteraceae bacterium]
MSRWTRRAIMQAGLAAGAWPLFAAERAADSLEALAHAKGMRFGTSLSGRALKDTAYLDLVRAQCGIIVPENELKMPVIQPQPGQFQFERADALLDFAAGSDLATRGHCLLWHHPRWLPKWLEGYDFGADPAKGAETLLTDHITRTTTRYQKRIRSWDVVNEAVDNITGEMRETPLSKAIGSPDQVLEIAFRSARANLPDAELVYNDYMGWESDNAPHRDGVLRLLERFRKNGVPVNALGIQAHIGAGNQDSNNNRAFDARDERAWRKFLDNVTGMGYALLVTEFDVHDAPLPADIAARDKAVAALARGFLDLTLSFTQVNAVLCWGLADSYTWLQRRNPRADGLPKRPTPYDVALQPKPLRKAMAAAFRAAPPRRPAAIAGIPA